MTDSEILKKLKATIKRGAFKHLFEHQRTEYYFGYKEAYRELWDDLKQIKEAQDEKSSGD